MLAASGFTADGFWWLMPGTEPQLSGGGYWSQLHETQTAYPGLRIIYVHGEAPLAGLRSLAKDHRIWLVDIGGSENYYWLAQGPD